MPLDVERVRTHAATRSRDPHPLATRVDCDLQSALGRRLEDREVARLPVRALRTGAEEDLDEAVIRGGRTLDLARRGQRILGRAKDRASQPRLAVEPLLMRPVVVRPGEGGSPVGTRHQRHGRRVVRVKNPDVGTVGIECLTRDPIERPRRVPRLEEALVVGEAERVRPRVAGQAQVSTRPEPLALPRIKVREEALLIGDHVVNVAVDHVRLIYTRYDAEWKPGSAPARPATAPARGAG